VSSGDISIAGESLTARSKICTQMRSEGSGILDRKSGNSKSDCAHRWQGRQGRRLPREPELPLATDECPGEAWVSPGEPVRGAAALISRYGRRWQLS